MFREWLLFWHHIRDTQLPWRTATVNLEFTIKTNNDGVGEEVRQSACWVWGTKFGFLAAAEAAGHCKSTPGALSTKTWWPLSSVRDCLKGKGGERQKTLLYHIFLRLLHMWNRCVHIYSHMFCICEQVCTHILSHMFCICEQVCTHTLSHTHPTRKLTNDDRNKVHT